MVFFTSSTTKCESMRIVSLEGALGLFLCVSFYLLRFETLPIKDSIKINCGEFNPSKHPRGG